MTLILHSPSNITCRGPSNSLAPADPRPCYCMTGLWNDYCIDQVRKCMCHVVLHRSLSLTESIKAVLISVPLSSSLSPSHSSSETVYCTRTCTPTLLDISLHARDLLIISESPTSPTPRQSLDSTTILSRCTSLHSFYSSPPSSLPYRPLPL